MQYTVPIYNGNLVYNCKLDLNLYVVIIVYLLTSFAMTAPPITASVPTAAAPTNAAPPTTPAAIRLSDW